MKYGNLTLGQIEAGINKIGGEEAFLRLLRDKLVISEAIAKKLLERISTIAIPTMTQFIAGDNFIVNTSKISKVKISSLGNNFKNNFLPKVESDEVAVEDLAINKLLENAYDRAIIAALGGEAKVEITLGQFFAAFAKQPNGEKGTLLTNGYANVGYVSNITGVLWAVFGDWDGGGWIFGAYPLDRLDCWGVSDQFLSR